MSDSMTPNVRVFSALIAVGRVVSWAVPIILWLVHVFVIVPLLNARSGDAQFLMAMHFFQVSGMLMIVALSPGLSFIFFARGDSAIFHSFVIQQGRSARHNP